MTRLPKFIRKPLVGFLASLTPTCRRIVALGSQRIDSGSGLGPITTPRIRFHCVLCKACARYLQQLDFLHKAAGQSSQHFAPGSVRARLPDGAKHRIRERMHREQASQ
jgi:hypothetical protein